MLSWVRHVCNTMFLMMVLVYLFVWQSSFGQCSSSYIICAIPALWCPSGFCPGTSAVSSVYTPMRAFMGVSKQVFGPAWLCELHKGLDSSLCHSRGKESCFICLQLSDLSCITWMSKWVRLEPHVNSLVCSSFRHLRNIAKLRPAVFQSWAWDDYPCFCVIKAWLL